MPSSESWQIEVRDVGHSPADRGSPGVGRDRKLVGPFEQGFLNCGAVDTGQQPPGSRRRLIKVGLHHQETAVGGGQLVSTGDLATSGEPTDPGHVETGRHGQGEAVVCDFGKCVTATSLSKLIDPGSIGARDTRRRWAAVSEETSRRPATHSSSDRHPSRLEPGVGRFLSAISPVPIGCAQPPIPTRRDAAPPSRWEQPPTSPGLRFARSHCR